MAAGSGAITDLAAFNITDGAAPNAALVEDASGNLFGTTQYGGAANYGTVFELAAGTGSVTTLVSFNDVNGAYPLGGLVEDDAGNLYGTTSGDNIVNEGTVFEVPALPTVATIDTVPPTVTLTAPANNSYSNNATPTLTATAADNPGGSGLASVQFQYSNNGGMSWTNAGPAQTSAPFTYTFTSALPEGAYLAQAVATDNAGNIATSSPVAFDIDLTPPTVTITAQPPQITESTSATFSFTATDPVSNGVSSGVNYLQYSLDGSSYVTTTSPLNLTGLNIGVHTLDVLAVDNAGNVGAAATYTWAIIGATHLAVSGPTLTLVAGTPFNFTVTAEDVFGNPAASFTGTVTLTSSDGQAILPAMTYTFTSADAGTHTFSGMVLETAGMQSVTATDLADGFIAAETGIAISASTAASLTLAGYPSATTAGTSHAFTVTVRDAYGNAATGFSGTVTLSSTDSGAVFTLPYTFTSNDAGVHTFSTALTTSGAQAIAAADSADSFTASESGIVVNAAAASSLVVAGFPTTATAGAAEAFTVTACDAYGNLATSYSGTVTLSSSDTQATFTPPTYTFGVADDGVHTFLATLNTPGPQSITAADTGLTGSETGIQVTTLPASRLGLVVSGFSSTSAGSSENFTVRAVDAMGNTVTGFTGVVTLTSSDPRASFAGTVYTFTTGDNGSHTFTGSFATAGDPSRSWRSTSGTGSSRRRRASP